MVRRLILVCKPFTELVVAGQFFGDPLNDDVVNLRPIIFKTEQIQRFFLSKEKISSIDDPHVFL